MKVLFLSLWYPNRYDAMSGLFVRKHAEAAAKFSDVAVLYLCPNASVSNFEVVNERNGDINEIIIYYKATNSVPLKIYRYLKGYHIGFQYLLKNWGKPDITHSNVLTRTAFMGYFIKQRYGIPYVVTEHWSRYLDENLSYKGLLRKALTKFVVKHAESVMPVSQLLQIAMMQQGLIQANYQIVPNVVDDFFYVDESTMNRTCVKQFLHVSCFDEKSKNVLGIVAAINKLWQKRQDFQVVLVGTGTGYQQVKEEVLRLSLMDTAIKMTGEQTPLQVKEWFSQSDAFILFSNYETAAVVLAESVASGVPIISTPVGIAPEIVNRETGILIPKADIDALAEAMEYMLDHSEKFDSMLIRNYGNLFTMNAVSEQLKKIYQDAIMRNK